MTGLSFLLALAATGVEYDWQAIEQGNPNYVVRTESERPESASDSNLVRHTVRREPLGDPNYASALGNSQYGSTPGFSPGSAAYTSGQASSYNQAAGYGQVNPYGQTSAFAQNGTRTTTAASPGTAASPPSLLGQTSTVTATNDAAARSTSATTGSAWSDRNWNHAGATGTTATNNTSLSPNGLNTAVNNAVNNATAAGQSAWNDARRRAASAVNGVADTLGSRFGATSPTTGLPAAPDPRYTSQPGYNEAAIDPRYGASGNNATGYTAGAYGNLAPVGQAGSQLGGNAAYGSNPQYGSNGQYGNTQFNANASPGTTAPNLERRPYFGNDPNYMANQPSYTYGADPRLASNPSSVTLSPPANAQPNGGYAPAGGYSQAGGYGNPAPTGNSVARPDPSGNVPPGSNTQSPTQPSANTSGGAASGSLNTAPTGSFTSTNNTGFSTNTVRRDAEPNSPSDVPTLSRKTSSRDDEETSSSLMLACLLLFASLGGNAFLTWICWGIHERYRQLATQVSRNSLRAHSESL